MSESESERERERETKGGEREGERESCYPSQTCWVSRMGMLLTTSQNVSNPVEEEASEIPFAANATY